MRDRFLRRLAQLVLTHPRAIALFVVVLFAAAVAALPGLRVEAGHSSLVDESDVHMARFERFLKKFGSPNLLIAVVEGGNERLRRQAIDGLLDRLPHRSEAGQTPPPCRAADGPNSPGCVRDVLGRIALDKIKAHALLFVPAKSLAELVKALKGETLGLRTLLGLTGLRSLFAAMAAEIEQRTGSSAALSADDRKQAETVLDLFDRFLRVIEQRIRADDKRKPVPLEEALFKQSVSSGVDPRGYLSSPDGKYKLCLIRPLNDSDAPAVVVPFVRYVERQARAAVQTVRQRCSATGESCPEGSLRVRLTGLPAIIADENEIVSKDVVVTTLVAIVGILALFIFGFRSVRQSALGLPPLLVGLVLTLAVVRLAFGNLNLVTAAFIATLLGLGIDFAVHFLSRYNEARQKGAEVPAAVEAAFLGAGPGILTGALTTAGAFVALALNDFMAFSQLGIITGVGLVLVLLMTLTLLPAMLAIPRLRKLQGRPRPAQGPPRIDLPGVVVRHPWVFVLAGLLLAAVMLFKAQQIPWSYDYIKLMPEGLDSVQAMKVLADKTDYSAGVAAVEAPSLREAKRMAEHLRTRPTIRRVDAVTSYVPTDQERKLALLGQLKPILDASPPRPAAEPLEVTALAEALQELADNLEDARFEAKRGGAEQEAKLLDKPIAAVARVRRALKEVPAERSRPRLEALQREVLAGLDEGLRILRENVTAEPITAETLLAQLPPGLRDRLYQDGHYAIYAYPTDSIGDKEFLIRFVADVRTVSPEATGFPVTHLETSLSIEKGFRDAAVAASVALLLLLLLDFRSLRYTLLALAPLGLGVAWMWGSMSLVGIQYTYVNIIAFPLIIGIGVASGVHILHRYRQEGTGNVAPVVRYTGMAVFLSAATTMVGFGSLALARHQGAAGLGVVLLLGVGFCLIAAVLFLPALLQLLRNRLG